MGSGEHFILSEGISYVGEIAYLWQVGGERRGKEILASNSNKEFQCK